MYTSILTGWAARHYRWQTYTYSRVLVEFIITYPEIVENRMYAVVTNRDELLREPCHFSRPDGPYIRYWHYQTLQEVGARGQ